MKQYVETRKCDDGFTYEVWRRQGINSTLYYAANRFTKEALLGGCVFECPEELHKVMNLPR